MIPSNSAAFEMCSASSNAIIRGGASFGPATTVAIDRLSLMDPAVVPSTVFAAVIATLFASTSAKPIPAVPEKETKNWN